MTSREHTTKRLLHDDSFRKWVRGEATESERAYWDDWVKKSGENREIARNAMQVLTGFSIDSIIYPNSSDARGRFNARLNDGEESMGTGRSSIGNSRLTDQKWVYRMAAGFLILITVGLVVHFGYSTENYGEEAEHTVTQQRVSTGYGELKTIKLGDGTVINLNANSAINYRANSENPTAVSVELTGEAFFNVSEREGPDQSPFRVLTEDGIVRVLGTEFAISTRDRKTQVVLEKGSVEIAFYREESRKNRPLILEPNHLAEFDNSNDTLIVKPVNTRVYTSWKTDKLVFDHTPLLEVLNRIEHTFGVTVKINDPALKQRTLSGTIENSKIDVILSTLSQTLSAPVVLDGETVFVGKDAES